MNGKPGVPGIRLGLLLFVLGMLAGLAGRESDDILAHPKASPDPPLLEAAGSDEPLSALNRNLADLNWMEIDGLVAGEVDVVFLPVGSMEAHGVINNGADTGIATGLATRVAERLGGLVAPAIPYGVRSAYGLFPGSIQIGEEAFSAYVSEVLFALADEGFENIVVLNGQPSNRQSLDRLTLELTSRMKVRTLVVDWWTCCADVSQEFFSEHGGHAGADESALVQALSHNLVREDLFREGMARPLPAGTTAHPLPSAMTVTGSASGRPPLDGARSRLYLDAVVDRITTVVLSVLRSWDDAGV